MEAVIEEIQKLFEAEAIRKVHYPEWMANTVVVKKKTRKWRVAWPSPTSTKLVPKTVSH